MKPIDKIKELINKSNVQTGPETDKKILGDAMEYLEKLKQQKSAGTMSNIWRISTKDLVMKLAVAAAILITFGVGFFTGRWSKPVPPPHLLNITGYTSAARVNPATTKAENSFWQQKALAALQPRPYVQSHNTKVSLLDIYKQYLKEKKL